jgi:hypothetical protein
MNKQPGASSKQINTSSNINPQQETNKQQYVAMTSKQQQQHQTMAGNK